MVDTPGLAPAASVPDELATASTTKAEPSGTRSSWKWPIRTTGLGATSSTDSSSWLTISGRPIGSRNSASSASVPACSGNAPPSGAHAASGLDSTTELQSDRQLPTGSVLGWQAATCLTALYQPPTASSASPVLGSAARPRAAPTPITGSPPAEVAKTSCAVASPATRPAAGPVGPGPGSSGQ